MLGRTSIASSWACTSIRTIGGGDAAADAPTPAKQAEAAAAANAAAVLVHGAQQPDPPAGPGGGRGRPAQGLAAFVDAVPGPGCSHTDRGLRSGDPVVAAAAAALLRAGQRGAGLAVAAEAGKMVVFFSRGRGGGVDPLAFHGGADVVGGEPGTGKWTMQLFRAAALPELPATGAAFDEAAGGDAPPLAPGAAKAALIARAQLRAAASGSGPMVRGAEDAAREAAVKARRTALLLSSLPEDKDDEVSIGGVTRRPSS